MDAKSKVLCVLLGVAAIAMKMPDARSGELPPTISSGRVVIYDPLHWDLTFMPTLCAGSVGSPDSVKEMVSNSGANGGFIWSGANTSWIVYDLYKPKDELSTLPELLNQLAYGSIGYLYIRNRSRGLTC